MRLPLCHDIGHNSEFNEDVVLALLDCEVGKDGLARLSIPLARLPHLRVLIPRANGSGSASIVAYRNRAPQKGSNRYHLVII